MHETAHFGSGQSERDARGDMARCRLFCCLLSGILTRGSQGALPPPTLARGVPRWVAHGMDIDEGDPLAPAVAAAWQAAPEGLAHACAQTLPKRSRARLTLSLSL